jgi:inosine/xanthosine triphosphatase
MRVIVASHNPVKINATKQAFERVFPNQQIEVEGVTVSSGISDQPMTDADTKTGSYNRAVNARELNPDADYWVGLEGGIYLLDDQMLTLSWITVLSKDKIGQSRTGSYVLPEKVKQLVLSGMELGHADDIVFNKSNSKQQNGAIGILTHDIIDRTQGFSDGVILALIPFMNEDLY